MCFKYLHAELSGRLLCFTLTIVQLTWFYKHVMFEFNRNLDYWFGVTAVIKFMLNIVSVGYNFCSRGYILHILMISQNLMNWGDLFYCKINFRNRSLPVTIYYWITWIPEHLYDSWVWLPFGRVKQFLRSMFSCNVEERNTYGKASAPGGIPATNMFVQNSLWGWCSRKYVCLASSAGLSDKP